MQKTKIRDLKSNFDEFLVKNLKKKAFKYKSGLFYEIQFLNLKLI